MRDRFVLLIVLLVVAVAACARDDAPRPAEHAGHVTTSPPATIEGRATVVDGDTLTIARDGMTVRVRLHGVDAPELAQTCAGKTANGRPPVAYACGAMARSALVGLIGEEEVACFPRAKETNGRDRYGRVVATCIANGRDLGRELVRLGWARAYTRYGRDYAADEGAARQARRGFWSGEWQAPADWRRAR